jgi:hypothetical protein
MTDSELDKILDVTVQGIITAGYTNASEQASQAGRDHGQRTLTKP